MKVYIGYDEREHRAALVVCMKTLLDVTRGEVDPEFLSLGALQSRGSAHAPQRQAHASRIRPQ